MMRKLFTAVVAVTLLAAGGVAYAQWIADGTGQGRAVAGSVEGLSISPGVPTTPLFPGGSGDVALTITNTNPFDVTVTALLGDGPVVALDAACEVAGHEVTYLDQTGEWIVGANDSLDVVLADAATMGAGAANECQGVEFSVPLSLG